jgi:hypothetical protein
MPKKRKEESMLKYVSRRGVGRTSTSSVPENDKRLRPRSVNSGAEDSSGSKRRSTSDSSGDEFAFMRSSGYKKSKRLRRDVIRQCVWIALILPIQGESSAMKKLKSGFAQSRPLDEELDRIAKEDLKDVQPLKSSDEDDVEDTARK